MANSFALDIIIIITLSKERKLEDSDYGAPTTNTMVNLTKVQFRPMNVVLEKNWQLFYGDHKK